MSIFLDYMKYYDSGANMYVVSGEVVSEGEVSKNSTVSIQNTESLSESPIINKQDIQEEKNDE